jgi:hypothetical protein
MCRCWTVQLQARHSLAGRCCAPLVLLAVKVVIIAEVVPLVPLILQRNVKEERRSQDFNAVCFVRRG